MDYPALAKRIKRWALELGFDQLGITGVDVGEDERHLLNWLGAGRHGEMHYMARHGTKRTRPGELRPGTVRVLSVRMDYLPEPAVRSREVLADPAQGFIARYALGRDYHKLMRKRLQQLAVKIGTHTGAFGYRAFVDSAPVMEKALARNAGLGWIGKHTNLINRRAGSWFLLGELYTDLPLPVDLPAKEHCGSCQACIDVCPTGAIVAPFQLDARRCISYLTIELKGSIPVPYRRAIGNRIFGCDDCQQVCPWNRFAKLTRETDFLPRHGLNEAELIALFQWSEAQYRQRTEGSALRRTGYHGWLRNIAVALGNCPGSAKVVDALKARLAHPSALVREHVHWALEQHLSNHDT